MDTNHYELSVVSNFGIGLTAAGSFVALYSPDDFFADQVQQFMAVSPLPVKHQDKWLFSRNVSLSIRDLTDPRIGAFRRIDLVRLRPRPYFKPASDSKGRGTITVQINDSPNLVLSPSEPHHDIKCDGTSLNVKLSADADGIWLDGVPGAGRQRDGLYAAAIYYADWPFVFSLPLVFESERDAHIRNQIIHSTEKYTNDKSMEFAIVRRSRTMRFALQFSGPAPAGVALTLTDTISNERTTLTSDIALKLPDRWIFSWKIPNDQAVGDYVISGTAKRENAAVETIDGELKVRILFNPWHAGLKEGAVKLGSDSLYRYLQRTSEDILHGRAIGTSTANDLRPVRYLLQQYNPSVLNGAMRLLAQLAPRSEDRKDPNVVAKVLGTSCAKYHLSAKSEMLSMCWPATHPDCRPVPGARNIPEEILIPWLAARTSVQYGQCPLAAALAVALLRSVGIPARAVTGLQVGTDVDGDGEVHFCPRLPQTPQDYLKFDLPWGWHTFVECMTDRYYAFDPSFNIPPEPVDEIARSKSGSGPLGTSLHGPMYVVDCDTRRIPLSCWLPFVQCDQRKIGREAHVFVALTDGSPKDISKDYGLELLGRQITQHDSTGHGELIGELYRTGGVVRVFGEIPRLLANGQGSEHWLLLENAGDTSYSGSVRRSVQVVDYSGIALEELVSETWDVMLGARESRYYRLEYSADDIERMALWGGSCDEWLVFQETGHEDAIGFLQRAILVPTAPLVLSYREGGALFGHPLTADLSWINSTRTTISNATLEVKWWSTSDTAKETMGLKTLSLPAIAAGETLHTSVPIIGAVSDGLLVEARLGIGAQYAFYARSEVETVSLSPLRLRLLADDYLEILFARVPGRRCVLEKSEELAHGAWRRIGVIPDVVGEGSDVVVRLAPEARAAGFYRIGLLPP
jgi:hypothetical protein